jgi:hypothetical protein
MKSWKRFVSRLGFNRKQPERSLLLVGSDAAGFDSIAGLISELPRHDSRLSIILSCPDHQTLKWLENRFTETQVLPLPFANRISATLYLRQLNIRCVVFIDGNQRAANSLLAAIRRSAAGVVTVSGRGANNISLSSAASLASEALIVMGEEPAREVLPGNVVGMTVGELSNRLTVMLARDLKALREANLFSQIMARIPAMLAKSSRWRSFISWRLRRYGGLEELRVRLAAPKSIMCLGNGPSSEDATLATMQADALFRVNHSWADRNFLVSPDVVFTGGKPTFRAISGAIFGVLTPEAERNLLLLRSYNPLRGRLEFFNVNDVTQSIKQFDWAHLRPTNGVSMLATAIALNPEKLIVAGIDLFQHPEGSYPGNNMSANAYSPGHSRDTELKFILKLLSSYSGEVVIVGDVLRREWESVLRTNIRSALSTQPQ